MPDEQIKLQDAFNRGFVPTDIKEMMIANGHQGQVWVVDAHTSNRSARVGEDQDGNPVHKEQTVVRIGVGYKLLNADGSEQSHIRWYEPEEVQELLAKL